MATKRSYGEACRFAHALDVVGERWGLMVVRELLLGPKRFTDLREGLPRASTNILAERLRELEARGVVRRRKLPPPYGASVYELTEWGQELEPVVTQLGAWGARSPFPPDSELRIGADSIVLALRSLFDPGVAAGLDASYELRLDDERFAVLVADGELDLTRGTVEQPDAAIAAEPEALAAVLSGEMSVDAALASGGLEIAGSRRAAERFLRLFPMPEPCASAAAAVRREPLKAGA
jgi:DNA-binding HxlR family transcriptional regulator/putative sterol carrier protein